MFWKRAKKADWYERAMQSREDAYEARFGATEPEGQVLSPGGMWDTMIPGFALLQFPPTGRRPWWLTVTHGMAQPLDKAEFDDGAGGEASGYGVELAIATPDSGPLGPRVLESVARWMVSTETPIARGQRLPAKDVMEGGGALMVMSAPPVEESFDTASGHFTLLFLLGITGDEYDLAKTLPGTDGSVRLEAALSGVGVPPVTDPARSGATGAADFRRAWSS